MLSERSKALNPTLDLHHEQKVSPCRQLASATIQRTSQDIGQR